jgi:hypothetical protein
MLDMIRSSSTSFKRLGQECADAQMPEKLCRRAAATD